MHQDIAIPNIMVDITRESYCKPEWDVFQECLDSHTLVSRTKGQAMQKTKDLLMGSCDEGWAYEITRTSGARRFFKISGSDSFLYNQSPFTVREALHQCQVRAYDDRDLYFQAK